MTLRNADAFGDCLPLWGLGLLQRSRPPGVSSQRRPLASHGAVPRSSRLFLPLQGRQAHLWGWKLQLEAEANGSQSPPLRPGISLQLPPCACLCLLTCGACVLTLTLSGRLEEAGNSGSVETGPALRPFRASRVQRPHTAGTFLGGGQFSTADYHPPFAQDADRMSVCSRSGASCGWPPTDREPSVYAALLQAESRIRSRTLCEELLCLSSSGVRMCSSNPPLSWLGPHGDCGSHLSAHCL